MRVWMVQRNTFPSYPASLISAELYRASAGLAAGNKDKKVQDIDEKNQNVE